MLAVLGALASFARLDSIFPPDPGRLRMMAALRATAAGCLAFFSVVALGSVAAIPLVDRILAFAVALFIAATVRDNSPRRQLVTIALAPLVAFAATALATIFFKRPIAAAAAVPPLMFLIIYVAGRGPRYASLGMVALISYIVGLVSALPPATLPFRLVVLIVAAASAALVRLALLPERPQAELDRLRAAIHARIFKTLRRIAAALRDGRWTKTARAELRRDVLRLGDAVMLAQARVTQLADRPESKHAFGARWLHFLAIELAVERVARAALHQLGAADERDELIAAIEAIQRGAKPPPLRARSQLGGALCLLERNLSEPPRTGSILATAAIPTPAPPSSLRPALQTAIASALAIVLGELVSPNRWYWAAFAAFVMFQGTRSRSESIAKGLQFLIGTLAGVFIGLYLATLLAGDQILSLIAIVLGVFLAFQANVAAYGVMAFWLTIVLGLMFGLLGFFTPDLLLLRLKEAAVGAGCGGLVASLVLVRQERTATQDAEIRVLASLRDVVEGSLDALLSGAPKADLGTRILNGEQSFHDYNAIAQGEIAGRFATRNEALRRRVVIFGACEEWARELGKIALQSVKLEEPVLVASAQKAAERIDFTTKRLAAKAISEKAPAPSRDDAVAESGEESSEFGQTADESEATLAVRLLLRIEAALLHMAARR